MYIVQKQLENLKNLVSKGKVVVIYGPRRCGKTTLLHHYMEPISKSCMFVSGDDITVQEFLSSQSIEKLRGFVGQSECLVVDEAQRIPNIGVNLKLIVDHLPHVAVIATGSSAFGLAHHIGEPLTGRKFTLKLYPLSQMEIAQTETSAQTRANLESRLIYGSYPEVVVTPDNRQRELYLRELVGAYLYKDILELEGIRHSDKMLRLLQLLAFQIGKEVALHELGTQLGMSRNTVERYLDLLEKCFVLVSTRGLSSNARKEISKMPRYYFVDIGVRNAIINNFNLLSLRNDVGMLWENYIVMERLKKQEYLQLASNNYFWRTYDQKEIDWVEDRGGQRAGYEIKWSNAKLRPPKAWTDLYPKAMFETVTPENYLKFIT